MRFIRTEDFASIHDIFTKPTAVFIIPSFQRPFAWEAAQLKDLLDDMAKAHADKREHYLSALHLTEVSPAALKDANRSPDLLAISDFLDTANPDIQRLKDAAESNSLFTKQRQPLEIYAVVDGQQRLTTLYLLACQLSLNSDYDYLKEYLKVTLNYGNESIPKLIQNPSDDHKFLQEMITRRSPNPTTQAQRRMETIYNKLAKRHRAFDYFSNHQFKTSVLLLDSNYGLRSFLTLNDHGKKLTVLEVLKSFLMERTIDIGDNELLHGLYKVFGKLYQVLDRCQEERICLMRAGEEGDNQLVQLIAIYLWAGTHSEAQWHSGENAYREFFRKKLLDNHPSAEEACRLLNTWITAMEEVAEQLAQLVKYLSGDTGSEPSLYYPGRKIADDYRAVLLSLGVQPHFLALLLKFRVLCKREWHERFSTPFRYNTELISPIQDLIKQVKKDINDTQLEMERAEEYANELLEKTQSFLPDGDKREISMLEVIERLQLLNWNLGHRWYGSFRDSWHQTAVAYAEPIEFITHWATWDSGIKFIHQITFDSNETNFRYLLKEYEWNLGDVASHFAPDLHFSSDFFELEHIFAGRMREHPRFKAIGDFPAYGLRDEDDFKRTLLNRSGNLLFLPKACNKAVGNNLPDAKAAHFSNCPDQSGCSHWHTVSCAGNQMSLLGNNHLAYRYAVELRCAELALFALQRFFYPRKQPFLIDSIDKSISVLQEVD